MKDCLIIYEQADDGTWRAHCADFDDVIAVGTSREEVESRMKETLNDRIAYLREANLPVPELHTAAGYIAA